MKVRILFFFALAITLMQWQMSACNSSKTIRYGEDAVKNYFYSHADTLLTKLSALESYTAQADQVDEAKKLFRDCRFEYKKIEPIAEYYFQGLMKRVNGPALPDIKTEDGQVWPPHGFQLIEQLLYQYDSAAMRALPGEIRLLQTDIRFMKANMAHNAINAGHIVELIQHQFIRTASLGITGFDAPLSKLSLEEAAISIPSIESIAALFAGDSGSAARLALSTNSITYLQTNNDFDSFNRLQFLTDYLMPLSELYIIPGANAGSDSLMVKPFKGTLQDFMTGRGFNADYYSSYAAAATGEAKIALGKKLFFDKSLSSAANISCGSCHQPGLYFTDGQSKASNFLHGGTLPRNTPTLYYAGLQSHQFYDLRSTTLEDQADQVMKNSNEFNGSSSGIAVKLSGDSLYAQLFRDAFGITTDGITGFQVRNALSAFVRSLSPFSSPFDEYMAGNKKALSEEQVRGFNLFAGKGKCATCHFIPLYNGNIPPWLTKSESEIIGVPSTPVLKNAGIDGDSGRYTINRMAELLFAFKTPGIRNIEKTGPYMHNGVYKTLEEVLEFYAKGGGAGIGIDLPFQSLPFDSLLLDDAEKKAIVSFMKSLTDTNSNY